MSLRYWLMSACIIGHVAPKVNPVFRPWCYMLMPICYSARLDNALWGVVKSAPFGSPIGEP